MGNFYDKWLRYWDEGKEARAKASIVIHEEDLEWVRTKQDYRAALLCSPENGFFTTGNAYLGEIPRSCNTGKHSHGEESIFILEGQGFSVVDGKRYDWGERSCLFMPYGSVHQHYNDGDKKVRYLSVMALETEKFAGLAKIIQYEEAAETPVNEPQAIEKAESDIHPEYGRIVLRYEDAPVIEPKDQNTRYYDDEFSQTVAKEQRTPGSKNYHTHSRKMEFMIAPENAFKAREVQITHLMCDNPGETCGKHAHMEALVFCLNGEGYSIVDGERVDWKKGSLLHVQGPQTVHQHFNTGKEESQLLRIHYGLRAFFFQSIAQRVFPYVVYEPDKE